MRSIIKNILGCSLLLLLLLSVLFSCNNPDKISDENIPKVEKKSGQPTIIASLNAVAPDSVRKNFQNLISVADCVSPLGKYTTQVNTDSGGYMYLKQGFSYGPKPFEAVLLKNSAWFILGDSTGPLPSALVFTVRSQAILNVLLEPLQQFHDFEDAGPIKMNDQILQKIKAKDKINNYCALYFDTVDRKLSAWEFINPDRRIDTILVRFSDWKNTGGFNLPFHADIEQRGKQLTFDFTRIEINSLNFKRITITPPRRTNKKK